MAITCRLLVDVLDSLTNQGSAVRGVITDSERLLLTALWSRSIAFAPRGLRSAYVLCAMVRVTSGWEAHPNR